MFRSSAVVPLVAALVLAALGLAVTAASRARGHSAGRAASAAPLAPRSAIGTVPSRPGRLRSLGPAPRARPKPESPEVLRVRSGQTVKLRAKPGGRVLATVGARTEFGSPTALSVAARRGHWVGAPHPALPNGRLGWLDERSHAASRFHSRVQLVVRLSRRRLELRQGGRVKRRVPVAIGRPGSTTPRGRFSVTDKLSGGRYGPYYGCCILALSGHQPHPPPGWQGGSRLAIHGTNAPGTIGTPSSAGCLRAADGDLRMLMRRVPLGTPVLIRS
ncbi:MAG TPA: L,D-transpeptidase [Thermoleophilaceae bacterium]|jgi:lipoprotein-anchoring transpeptidase ErfK/SrfK